jgi:hypothetical protein
MPGSRGIQQVRTTLSFNGLFRDEEIIFHGIAVLFATNSRLAARLNSFPSADKANP